MSDLTPATREDLDRIEAKLDSVLVGNPNDGKPGLWIRMDRVEHHLRALLWLVATAITATAAALIQAFTGPMKHH